MIEMLIVAFFCTFSFAIERYLYFQLDDSIIVMNKNLRFDSIQHFPVFRLQTFREH